MTAASRRVALDKSRLRNIASEASRELRKGKYAIDYLNRPPHVLYDCLRSSPPSPNPCSPAAPRRAAPRFAGNACLAFPGIVTTPSASEYCQPPRLNCITYYCLLFGVRFARCAPSHLPLFSSARPNFPSFPFLSIPSCRLVFVLLMLLTSSVASIINFIYQNQIFKLEIINSCVRWVNSDAYNTFADIKKKIWSNWICTPDDLSPVHRCLYVKNVPSEILTDWPGATVRSPGATYRDFIRFYIWPGRR